MNNAKRIFTRAQHKTQPMASFKSVVDRKLPNGSNIHLLGPGQYDLSLPMAKPQYQTIQKNSNTIIVKAKTNKSPVFQSQSPRFLSSMDRNVKTIDNKDDTKLQGQNQANQIRSLISLYEELQKHKNVEKNKNMWSRVRQGQIASQQKNYLPQIFNEPYRYKKNKETQFTLQNLWQSYKKKKKFGNRNTYDQLLEQMKKKAEQNSSQKQLSKIRAPQWSKYRQARSLWKRNDNIPGPGSYIVNQIQTIEPPSSWQFKSITKRNNEIDQSKMNIETKYKDNNLLTEVRRNTHKQSNQSIHSRLILHQ